MKKMEFGERLRLLRQSRNESIAQLADATGINKNTINAIEMGRNGAKLEFLERIADHYDVSIHYMLNYPEIQFTQDVPDESNVSSHVHKAEIIIRVESSDPEYIAELASYIKRTTDPDHITSYKRTKHPIIQ